MGAQYPDLKGKTVFITGGATGIGAALVEAFAGQGARVHFIDLLEDEGRNLADRLGQTFTRLDVTDTAALQAAVRASAAVTGRLDVLINNVANDARHDPLEVSPEYWRKCLAVNLDATFFAAQAAAPLMTGGGAIINFSSITTILGHDDLPGYVTAKAGILGLTRSLARRFGKDRIRVNAIIPGWIVTERQLALWLTPEAEAEWMGQTALPDRILPDDVANLALFLAHAGADKITGQSFIIDGGRV
jgi:D-xylose 1-dehydrogenase